MSESCGTVLMALLHSDSGRPEGEETLGQSFIQGFTCWRLDPDWESEALRWKCVFPAHLLSASPDLPKTQIFVSLSASSGRDLTCASSVLGLLLSESSLISVGAFTFWGGWSGWLKAISEENVGQV